VEEKEATRVIALIHSDSEYIPVEYKEMASNKRKLWPDHKYQLTAHALLIDEAYVPHV